MPICLGFDVLDGVDSTTVERFGRLDVRADGSTTLDVRLVFPSFSFLDASPGFCL